MSKGLFDRAEGVMVGVAVGDLLGSPIEGYDLSTDPSKTEFLKGYELISADDPENGWKRRIAEAIIRIRSRGKLVDEYLGHVGTYFWEYGETTDDTAQTVAVAESLVDNGSFIPEDIAARLVSWYNGGRGKGLGGTTALALQLQDPAETHPALTWDQAGRAARMKTQDSAVPYKGRFHKTAYPVRAVPSNGALMRTAPIGVFLRNRDNERAAAAENLCIITHDFEACIETAQLQADLIATLVTGADKKFALDHVARKHPIAYSRSFDALKQSTEDTGYTGGAYTTLGVALDSFMSARSAEEVIISAINSTVVRKPWMNDVDTYGAVAGALAGAHYGFSAFPEQWYAPVNPDNGRQYEMTPHSVSTLRKLGQLLVKNSKVD